VTSIAFSPDGKTLASASCDKTTKLWDTATGKELSTLKGHTEEVVSVAFSPDGKVLASGDGDVMKGTIKLWDVATRKEITILHRDQGAVTSLAFSPDGTMLASGYFDQTIKLWDTKTWKAKITLKSHALAPQLVNSVDFSPEGKSLASGDLKVRVWDLQTAKEIFSDQDSFLGGYNVAFGKTEKILAWTSPGNTIRVWDLEKKKLLTTLDGPDSYNITLAFRRDGKLLAGAWTYANSIRLFEMPSGKVTSGVETRLPVRIAFSPDGRTLASGSLDKTITLWDVVADKRPDK
jgi:WD40 repeat protein